jgi:hypothetical protein
MREQARLAEQAATLIDIGGRPTRIEIGQVANKFAEVHGAVWERLL